MAMLTYLAEAMSHQQWPQGQHLPDLMVSPSSDLFCTQDTQGCLRDLGGDLGGGFNCWLGNDSLRVFSKSPFVVPKYLCSP